MRRWLKELTTPVAVLADHDSAAHDLADMCQLLGLRVPDDVAILGVDDDELECQLAFPPLSSVAIPAERIGFEAAKLLDRMLADKRLSKDSIFLPPVRVVPRHSTSMFAVDESMVTAALHYIRNHLAEPLKVSAIAEKLVVRRRALEQKFRALLGRSVLDEIHRVHSREGQGTAGEHQIAHLQSGGAVGFLDSPADGHGFPQGCRPDARRLPPPNLCLPPAVKPCPHIA